MFAAVVNGESGRVSTEAGLGKLLVGQKELSVRRASQPGYNAGHVAMKAEEP